jgi:hypothetical protein
MVSQNGQKILAETAPMGWNSRNCLGIEAPEEQGKAVADYMAGQLKEYENMLWWMPDGSTLQYSLHLNGTII